jgi:cardiolipin synthase A/B
MFDEDLTSATEVVLDAPPAPRRPRLQNDGRTASAEGSAGRAAAGLLRVTNTIGAAVTGHRVLEPVEARIMLAVALMFFLLAAVGALLPRLLTYPLVVVSLWMATSLAYRSYRLARSNRGRAGASEDRANAEEGS